MEYASVSVKFPIELDAELERFIDETGIYTNKSEFIKEACRAHLQALNNEPAMAALRLEQLLADAEQNTQPTSDIEAELATLAETVDSADLERALTQAREETAERVYGTDA